MKWLFICACLLGFNCFGQEIEENKTDEFTKQSIVSTTWEKFCTGSLKEPLTTHVKISKVNGVNYLDLKAMDGSVFSVREGAELMLKTATDSIITLHNLKYQITCTGCGAKGSVGSASPGVSLSFKLTPSQKQYLKSNQVVKIRLYTTEGYLEKEIKEKQAKVLIKELELTD